MRIHRVQDIGSEDFCDLGEFPPVDPEEDVGEGRVLGTAPTPADALELAERDAGADPERWVNEGLAESEYADDRSRLGPP